MVYGIWYMHGVEIYSKAQSCCYSWKYSQIHTSISMGEYPGYSLLPLHTAFNPSHLPLPLKSTLNWTIN